MKRLKALLKTLGDVMAWLVSLATLSGVDIEEAVAKYTTACPKCATTPCSCPMSRS